MIASRSRRINAPPLPPNLRAVRMRLLQGIMLRDRHPWCPQHMRLFRPTLRQRVNVIDLHAFVQPQPAGDGPLDRLADAPGSQQQRFAFRVHDFVGDAGDCDGIAVREDDWRGVE